jgi:hypothetical protein
MEIYKTSGYPVSKTKDIETGLVPLSTSVMWVMADGLGLLQATPGPVLGYRRFRREEGKNPAILEVSLIMGDRRLRMRAPIFQRSIADSG